MNFRVVEGEYYDIESIFDDFEEDYLHSDMNVKQLREKYGLSRYMYAKLASLLREKHNLTRRPCDAKYFHKHGTSWVIVKDCNGKTKYFGRIPIKYGKEVLDEAIETCKSLNWDISECQKRIKEIKNYAKLSNQ